MGEGYAIIDLGMTAAEFNEAISEGSFDGTEKQYNDILAAIKTGKQILVSGTTPAGNGTISASPYITTTPNGAISAVGYLTAPMLSSGFVVSLLVYIEPVTYGGHAIVIPLAGLD